MLDDGLVLPERPALIRPTHFHSPEYVSTLGPEVAELCALARFAPDPEQAFLLDGIFGLDRRGRLAAFETCVIAPRQNVKTGLKKQAALGKIFLLKRKLYVWTAHEFPTTQEAFRDLSILIESTPEFDRRVQRITRGNGDESIELDGGQRIIFRARTKAGGRGLSGDDVGYDEAFALQPEHIGATMPLLSTRPNPQVGYWSSACLRTSRVLAGVVKRGRAGQGSRLLYAEWCFPGEPGERCASPECDHDPTTPGCSLDDLELLQQSNTQAGGRIPWQYLLDERQAMVPSEHGRERAGWHDPIDQTGEPPAIDVEAFRGLLNPSAKQPRRAVVAVAVSKGRKAASIGVAGDGSDGKTLVFVRHFQGTTGVVSQLERMLGKRDIVEVVLNPRGQVAALLPDLAAAGVEHTAMSAGELGQACVWFQTAVATEALEHGGQAELLTAVENAKTRTSGEGEMWDLRDPDVDITAVQAAAMAGYRFAASKSSDYDPLDSIY